MARLTAFGYFWPLADIRHLSKMCRNQWYEELRSETPKKRKQ